MTVSCCKLKEHIIEHEILGFEVSGQLTETTLSIYDEGTLVLSGLDEINFIGDWVTVTQSGVSRVNIEVVNPPIQVDENLLWVYDSSRSKWLSVDRMTAISGRKGRAKNVYLRLIEGQASNLTGYRMVRDGTITAISAQTRGNETWTLKVQVNGSDVASLAMSNEMGNHDTSINVDVNEGDLVQFYAETTTFLGIKDPFVWAEIAWRNNNL